MLVESAISTQYFISVVENVLRTVVAVIRSIVASVASTGGESALSDPMFMLPTFPCTCKLLLKSLLVNEKNRRTGWVDHFRTKTTMFARIAASSTCELEFGYQDKFSVAP
jgi:hypothetical protein